MDQKDAIKTNKRINNHKVMLLNPLRIQKCLICDSDVDQCLQCEPFVPCDITGIPTMRKHPICFTCFNEYIKENVLTHIHTVKQKNGLISCPFPECIENFDTVLMFR